MLTILLFLAVLIILVLVHEVGHAVFAKVTGCRVEEFGVGFPPRLVSRRVGETVYSLNVIPLGGFVRITGEDGETLEDPRSFSRKPRVVRGSILLAGVGMNLLLAVLLFALIAGIGSTVAVEGIPSGIPLRDARVQIVQVADTPVLARAGVRPGDVLVDVAGTPAVDAEHAAGLIRGFTGTELTLTLRRENVREITQLAFETPHISGETVGLGLLDVATYRVPWARAPLEGLRATGRVIRVTAEGLWRLVHEGFRERIIPADVAGPVGIASLVGTIGRQGILPLMELTAVLSVNLALINALPVPALDGGRVLFLLLDAVGLRVFRGRPERLAHAIGFALLMALVTLITISDIQRLFRT